jgi:hypothetical protein
MVRCTVVGWPHLRWIVIFGVSLALLSLCELPGAADDVKPDKVKDMDEAAELCAVQIQAALKRLAYSEKEIFVRKFVVRLRGDDVGIPKAIGDRLAKPERNFVIVNSGAKAEVSGNLLPIPPDPTKRPIGVAIKGKVVTSAGEESFFVTVDNPRVAERYFHPGGETKAPPDKPGPARQDPIVVRNTRLQPSARSPYGLEILVKRDGKYVPLEISMKEKLGYISLKEGDIYAIRLYNDTEFDAAVWVSIDGLNRFDLAEKEEEKKSVDIVLAGKTREIPGYYRNSMTVDSFKVGEYSQSPAVKKQLPTVELGTITVTFAAAWEKGKNGPEDESKGRPVSGSRPLTTAGPPIPDPTVKVYRVIGLNRAILRIRY